MSDRRSQGRAKTPRVGWDRAGRLLEEGVTTWPE